MRTWLWILVLGVALVGCPNKDGDDDDDDSQADDDVVADDDTATDDDDTTGDDDTTADDDTTGDDDTEDCEGPPIPVDQGSVTFEVYTDRTAFEARLQGCVHIVDFDDIDTSGPDPVEFLSERYVDQGIFITGEEGQFADEDFLWGTEFLPTSEPNMYAPGPTAPQGSPVDAGGNQTEVAFDDQGEIAAVAGFGLYFLDPDWPGIGQSSVTWFNLNHIEITGEDVDGPDASQMFRGIVTVDAKGAPVSAILTATIINGSGWVENDKGEGVALDDFVYARPVIYD